MAYGIPGKRINITLKKTDPTKITVEALEEQLHNIGLECEHTDPERLAEYKKEVECQWPNGSLQSWGIDHYKPSGDGSASYAGDYGDQLALYQGLEKSSEGNWEAGDDALGYRTELATIQYPAHFDYLMDKRPSFTGTKNRGADPRGPLRDC